MIGYVPKIGGWKNDSQQAGVEVENDYTFADNESAVTKSGIATETTSGAVSADGTKVDLRPWCSKVESQGHVSSCVGNAIVGGLEYLRLRQGLPHVDLSRLFVYYNSRLMHNDVAHDDGTYIRLAMGTLSSLGTCTEAKWAYDPAKVFTRPSWGAYREAYPFKIKSFYRLSDNSVTRHDQILKALRAQHPVVFGMKVDQAYLEAPSSGAIAMPGATRKILGGHAQLIVGCDTGKKIWVVRNSWGPGWAASGYAYVPWAYLDVSGANDFWVQTA